MKQAGRTPAQAVIQHSTPHLHNAVAVVPRQSQTRARTDGEQRGRSDDVPEMKPAPDKITPELGKIGTGKVPTDPMADGPLLKSTVQIVADDTEFDEAANTFLGSGNCIVAIIGGHDFEARSRHDFIQSE